MTDYTQISDDQLLERYREAGEQLAYCLDYKGRLEQEMHRRMEERGATMIPSDSYVCEAPIRYDYPDGCFTPLKEEFTESELAECITPAWTETVEHPESWNTLKVISIARKHGKAAMDIVERQRIPKRSKIKFERKETK